MTRNDKPTMVTEESLIDDGAVDIIEVIMDYLADRRNVYCACFEGGTFCCVDCNLSRRTRTIHEMMP